MSKNSARWLAPLAVAAVIASTNPAAADTGADINGYTLTLPDHVVIASSGCTVVPYSIGMPATPPGDHEDGGPVQIQTPGPEFHSSASGWGEIGTTPTGATSGTIQVCDAAPGTFDASTSYSATDSHGNILGAFIILASVTFVAPATTTPPAAAPPAATNPHKKKKCKRVRRHHHWVRVCRH